MTIGTYLKEGDYVSVSLAIEERRGRGGRKRALLVLDRLGSPGQVVASAAVDLGSRERAIRQGEELVLARGGLLGAEAEGLACSPPQRRYAERMFSPPERDRFVHLAARRPTGG